MSTTRFELRLDKKDAKGLCPIRVIYQIQGQKKYFPTGLKCFPHNWNIKEQCAVYFDKKTAKKLAPAVPYNNFLLESETTDLNKKLNGFADDIANIEHRFVFDKVAYSPSMVMDALSTMRHPEEKKDDPGKSVTAFIEQFCNDSTATHKPGTLKVYRGLSAHLKAFQIVGRKKATFEAIDIPFLRAFKSYLTQDKTNAKGAGMNNITAAKQISTLKTLLNYARKIYKIKVNPDYIDFSVARNDSHLEVIALTDDELLTLFNLDLSNNERLDGVRSIFCFSCASGLRYKDLVQLKWEHIRHGVIKMSADKGGGRLSIPLNPISAAILEKYKGRLRPLPIISNQKLNEYLKELCELAGINTPIEIIREYGVKRVSEIIPKHDLVSIHVGRKTFTTLSLEKGIPIQDVMSLTGHSTFKSFKRYVNVTDQRKKAAMAQAWGEVKEHNLKVV